MSTSLFSQTPTVTVLDNRGLTVRDVAYQRIPALRTLPLSASLHISSVPAGLSDAER